MNITKNIKYIGVDDTDIDLFESQYAVPEGVSYNSYLILDDEVAIMDSVDRRKCDEWLCHLTDALAGRTPHYLVVQHMEPDHGGSIAAAMERWPEMRIVTSVKAVTMLKMVTSMRCPLFPPMHLPVPKTVTTCISVHVVTNPEIPLQLPVTPALLR